MRKNHYKFNFQPSRYFSVAVLLTLFLTELAFAAAAPEPSLPVPSAGRILQEIEGNKDLVTPQPPEVKSEQSDDQDGGDILITVKKFTFTGNTKLTADELEITLENLLNREISIKTLKTAPDLIAAYYQQKGFLAVASLPEQDISDGIVNIVIVEAKFGGTKIDGQYGVDFSHLKPEVAEKIISTHIPEGTVVDQTRLDRALTLVQRLPGVAVEANFQAGEKDSTTDVLLKIKDKSPVSAYFSADNTGGRATGRDKQFLSLSYNSPLKIGDLLTLSAMRANGVHYARYDYTLPIGSGGWKFGVNGSYLQYLVITPEFALIKPQGRSVVNGLDLMYPILISKKANLDFALNYDNKRMINKRKFDENEPPELVDYYSVRVLSGVLSGNVNDSFLSGGVTNFSLDAARGVVDMDGAPSADDRQQDNDRKGEQTRGYYNRVRWNLSKTQFLTDTLGLTWALSGQWADKNLDASEKLFLGGIAGVRAYPTSEAGGSEGFLSRLELTKYLPYNFSVSLFRDDGEIRQYKKTRAGSGASLLTDGEPNRYHLRGYGASLAWSGPYSSNFKATYATRIGDNPNPSITQDTEQITDSDGSRRLHVLWLNGSIAF